MYNFKFVYISLNKIKDNITKCVEDYAETIDYENELIIDGEIICKYSMPQIKEAVA